MAYHIPLRIIQKVVEYYFTTAKSMDLIAAQCGISKSSVFNIVQGKKGEDPELSLMRYLVGNLDKNGLDVTSYACAIRITRLFDEYGVDIETGESLIETILPTCYRLNWPPFKAIMTLKRFEDCAGEFKMNPIELSIARMRDMESYKEYHALVNKEKEKLKAFRDRNTREGINGVLLSGPTGLMMDGWTAAREAKLYKEKYYNVLKDIQQNKTMHVDKSGLSKLNDRLGYLTVTEEQVLEKSEDIRLEPEKYWFLFDDNILSLMSDSTVATPSESAEQIPSPTQMGQTHN